MVSNFYVAAMTLYLPYFGLTLLTLALLFGTGLLVLRALRLPRQETWFGLFLILLTGLLTVVAGFALFKTAGRTVLLPLLPLSGLVLWQLRRPNEAADGQAQLSQHQSVVADTVGRALLTTVLAAVALFAVRVLLLADGASSYLRTPFQDYVYYARVSTLPLANGMESRSVDFYNPQFVTAGPYHYLELWLNTLLVQFTGLPGQWCLYLVVYAVLTTLVFVGLRAVAAQVGLRGGWATALAGLLLLTNGVYWPFFAKIPLAENGRYVATSLLLLEPKLAPVYLMLLLGALLVLRQRYQAAATAWAMLPLVFVSTGPAVGVGLGLMALYLRFSGRVSWGGLVALLLPVVAVVGYVGLFYALQPAVPALASGAGGLPLPAASEARTIVNIFIGVCLSYGLYFGPLLAVVAGLGWHCRRVAGVWGLLLPLLVFGAGGLAGGAATRGLASHFLDSFQFASNFAAPLLPVTLAAVLGALLARAGGVARLATAGALLGLAAVNFARLPAHNHPMHETTRYSSAFLAQVGPLLAAAGPRGAYVLGDKDYKNVFMLSPDSYTAGTYVGNFKNGYGLASLSALDEAPVLRTDPRFAPDSVAGRQAIASGSFPRFVRLATRTGKYYSLDSAKLAFVRTQRVGFVCVSARAELPSVLRPLVRTEVRDAVSGEKFYLLRP